MFRNIAWLGGGSVLVKPVWILFLVAVCPRLLGVEAYGVMQSALALAGIALVFSDLGTSTLTLREVSVQPEEGGRYLSNVLVLRGALATVCVAGAVGVAAVLGYQRAALFGVAAACAYVVAQHLVGFTRVFFRVAEDLRLEAFSTVAERALVVVIGGAFLVATRSPVWTLAGMALGAAVVGLIQVSWVSRHLARFDARSVSGPFLRQAAWLAVPLGVADLLLALYYRTDQVMVEVMQGATAAGQYGQAYRILESLSLLPAIVVQSALFPRLSRLTASGAPEDVRQLAMRTGALLTLSGVAVSGVLWTVAPELIQLLSGDPSFAPAGGALRVLIWTFPLTCAKDVLYITALARRRYRVSVVIYAGAVILNVALNLWAIPRYGIVGASLTTLVSEAFTVFLFAFAHRRS